MPHNNRGDVHKYPYVRHIRDDLDTRRVTYKRDDIHRYVLYHT